MKVTVKDVQGKDLGEHEVKFPVIENGKGSQVVHDTVVAYLAGQRSGTASTKTMGEVAGTGKKPWRQKGTGRARAGSFASPLWRGGGVVFGPKPRDFSKKVSKEAKRLALRKVLSERLKSGDVVVVDELTLASPKTKEFLRVMSALQLGAKTLVITQKPDQNLTLASRNVPEVEVTTGGSLNTYQVLRFSKLLFTRSGWETVEQRLVEE